MKDDDDDGDPVVVDNDALEKEEDDDVLGEEDDVLEEDDDGEISSYIHLSCKILLHIDENPDILLFKSLQVEFNASISSGRQYIKTCCKMSSGKFRNESEALDTFSEDTFSGDESEALDALPVILPLTDRKSAICRSLTEGYVFCPVN